MRSPLFFRFLVSLVLLLGTHAWAQSNLFDSLVAIADADQLKILQQLKLSDLQKKQLGGAAASMVPKIRATKGSTPLMLALLPEAFAKVDAILTPEQRPLARQLVPRAHQWEKLKKIYNDYARKRRSPNRVVNLKSEDTP